MKPFVTLLLLMAPVMLLAQKRKKEKKVKLTPEQAATIYLEQFRIGMGFDTLYAVKHWNAGKDEDYPEYSYQFTLNVTTNAKSPENLVPYCESIKDTMLNVRRTYTGILLDTSSRKFQAKVKERKYTMTKTFVQVDYGRQGDAIKKGSNLLNDEYAPCRGY